MSYLIFFHPADNLTAEVLGPNFVQASYYSSGSAQGGSLQVEIIPYSKRTVTSPELVKQLQEKFDKNFSAAKVSVGQIDLGPPSAAFTVQIAAADRDAAFKAADDMAAYLGTVELKRPSGKVAHMRNVNVSSRDQHIRTDNKPIVTVTADFDGNDTTTLVTLAQDAVKQEFDAEKLATYNLPADAVSFNIGQESENQDSFKTLALAFPILLIVIFVLLAIQFRSLLQPLLIFMAIPFSIFGVMLGLRVTNNAISFFAMLGFFALVGLSIKNTILLTDYANQARRQGAAPIDAAVEALEARFRPLFATSMTAVVSLIPLALASPFWEGLAVVLIFGLLSSTFLVITVFPYYYLGAEYTRLKVSAKSFFIWFIATLIVALAAGRLFSPAIAAIIFPASLVLIALRKFYSKRLGTN
jgi:multidrug efflux pump subunit AcrB